LFDLQCTICERFTAFTPISIRASQSKEVFLLIRRMRKQSTKGTIQTESDEDRLRKQLNLPPDVPIPNIKGAKVTVKGFA